MKTRSATIDALRAHPQIDVLVIGGGVNGIGVYRDLALQGVRVLLVEKGDYCSGGSAGSSHMLHGGIRYLENGEFRLVREALHERDRLLKNAPHYAKPLPTTIPIFKRFSGLLNAPLKFLGLLNRPAERGALVIKIGLVFYDTFVGAKRRTDAKHRTMPRHRFRGRKATLESFPRLNPQIVCSATYYDAMIAQPERLCVEMLLDTNSASDQAFALNYAEVIGGSGDTVTIKDVVSGDSFTVKPKVVINAAGAWIDFANQALEQPTRFIGGTKGSHLILNHPELLAAIGGDAGASEIFFENNDGRIVLIIAYFDRVMVGTTDIRIDDPDQAVCTDEEIDYLLDLVKRVFPDIAVDRSHIVYHFSGVRPLPASDVDRTGAISRDHSIKTIEAGNGVNFPIFSLIGGKWTTFRAFSELAANHVLARLGRARRTSTKDLPIGGGKDYPTTPEARSVWLDDVQAQTGLSRDRLETLLDRYGAHAEKIGAFIAGGEDAPLDSLPDTSHREIAYIAQTEYVVHLDDFLSRRSLIAMRGMLTISPSSLEEVAHIVGGALGWSEAQIQAEIERTRDILRTR